MRTMVLAVAMAVAALFRGMDNSSFTHQQAPEVTPVADFRQQAQEPFLSRAETSTKKR